MKFDLNNPRTLATTAIMTALVLGLTLVHITTTPTGGYIHFGDIALYFAAFAFGPWAGLVAGGLGTALADVLGGYASFAPLTLIVHGLQGFVAGLIAYKSKSPWRLGLGILVGGLILVGGYFAGEVMFPQLFGGFAAALGEAPGNAVQGLFGVLGAVIYVAVARAYPRLRQADDPAV